MSGKRSKKIRQVIRKDDNTFLSKFAFAVQHMPLRGRINLAWQILTKTFGEAQNQKVRPNV